VATFWRQVGIVAVEDAPGGILFFVFLCANGNATVGETNVDERCVDVVVVVDVRECPPSSASAMSWRDWPGGALSGTVQYMSRWYLLQTIRKQ